MRVTSHFLVLAVCLSALKMADAADDGSSAPAAADNELTEAENKAGWRLLFNGRDHTGWKCNTGEPIATPIEDGCLQPRRSGGYLIVYDEQFEDFILKCDVKMSAPRCNSGIFFRVSEITNIGTILHSGFEVAVDSGRGHGYHDFGAVYDLVAPTKNASTGPEKWNTVELECRGPIVRVKVNGELVTTLDCDKLDKPGLREDGTPHKYNGVTIKDRPRRGHIGFQDHGQKVWFKNVKLLDLKKKTGS